MAQLLDISTWDHACPVLLPLGAPTMSTVFTASIGILVPFAIFVVFFFFYLHSLWLENAASSGGDADGGGAANEDGGGNYAIVNGGGKSQRYGDDENSPAVFVAMAPGSRNLGGGSSFIDSSQKKTFYSSLSGESRPGSTIRLTAAGLGLN